MSRKKSRSLTRADHFEHSKTLGIENIGRRKNGNKNDFQKSQYGQSVSERTALDHGGTETIRGFPPKTYKVFTPDRIHGGSCPRTY
jgi:hypothetical protein